MLLRCVWHALISGGKGTVRASELLIWIRRRVVFGAVIQGSTWSSADIVLAWRTEHAFLLSGAMWRWWCFNYLRSGLSRHLIGSWGARSARKVWALLSLLCGWLCLMAARLYSVADGRCCRSKCGGRDSRVYRSCLCSLRRRFLVARCCRGWRHCLELGLRLDLNRLILTDIEANAYHGLFVVVDAHLSIILVVLLVLEECDPLVVCVQTAVQNDELRDGNTAYVFWQTSSLTDESDAIGRHLLRQGHRRRCLLWLTHVLCV